jgi:hypothetical protein
MVDTFSQRHGYKKIKEIQFESMDNDLRNRLWNQINTQVPPSIYELITSFASAASYPFIYKIWTDYLGMPVDEIQLEKGHLVLLQIKERYYKFEWHEVYAFLEYVIYSLVEYFNKERFVLECNKILESERAAYRIIGNKVVPITDKESIKEIERAISSPLKAVSTHLETALKFYADRKNPDYRNSIKESISAVEAICTIITKDKKASLGQALGILKNNHINIPTALSSAFEKIYGYTSSKDGIRHGLTDDVPNVGEEDARYMLIACSAFVNYLMSKANKAKILF